MAEKTLDDSEAMRRFAGIESGDDRIPDETTILNFRHLPERHGLTEAIFAAVNGHLADKGITLRSGTRVDLRGHTPLIRARPRKIIDAPCSTTNKAGARPRKVAHQEGQRLVFRQCGGSGIDPGDQFPDERPHRRRCRQRLDLQPGDLDRQAARPPGRPTARLPDARVRNALLHGEETSVWADKGYVSAEREAAFTGPGKAWGVLCYIRSPGGC